MNNTSIAGMKRTHMCGELRLEHAGQTVTVNGWVDRVRDNGGVLFLLLRDRAGIVQCTFDKSVNADLFDIAFTCRTEFVVAVKGKLVARDAAAINKKMPTGEVEIIAEDIRILSKAETTPFEIDDTKEVGDQIRLKYRYLDLRRPSMQKNLMLRHRVTQVARNYFDEHGFLEIETPMLTKSTPEGRARLPRAVPCTSGQVLRPAAVPAAVQAAAHAVRHGPLHSDHPLLPRRGPACRPSAGVHPDRP